MNHEIAPLSRNERQQIETLIPVIAHSLKFESVLSRSPSIIHERMARVIATITIESLRLLSIPILPRYKLLPENKHARGIVAQISVPHRLEPKYSGVMQFRRRHLQNLSPLFVSNPLRGRTQLWRTTAHEVYHIREARLFPSHFSNEAIKKYKKRPWTSDRAELAAEIFSTNVAIAKLRQESFLNVDRYATRLDLILSLRRLMKYRQKMGY